MASLMGFRFHPTDVEKITYLLCKVTGLHMPCSDFIGMADLYGEKEPWEIFGDSDEGELYFFTILKKVGKKKDDNKRFCRNVGKGGTWSNKGQKVAIYGKRGGLIGHKRCFRYEAKKEEDDHHQINGGGGTTWLLKEYTLPDNFKGAKEEYKDCVLCLLKRKKKKAEKETPRVVESSGGLDDIYKLLLGSATNNDIYTLGGPENPPLLLGPSNYDHSYVDDNPETTTTMSLRNIAEQFVEEEQDTELQMTRSIVPAPCYDNNNIIGFGGDAWFPSNWNQMGCIY